MVGARTQAWRRGRRIVAVLLMTAMVFGPAGCGGGLLKPHEPQATTGVPGTVFSLLLKGIISGIGSWTTEQGLGWLLSLTGSDQDQITDEMRAQMDQMDAKLDQIISDLNVIEGQLTNILIAIGEAQDAIINNNENLAIKDDLDELTNQYANLSYFTKDIMGTPTGQQTAQNTADDILGPGYDIDQRLFNIYSGVMGTDLGINEGAMAAWTTTLIDKVGTEDLLDLYMSLEYYFGSLITKQTKGLALMVEALHYRDNPITGAAIVPGEYPGTALEYLEEKFKPWMYDETEEFLRCVDRLVVAGLDLRTNSVVAVQMVPDEVQTIYWRADFLAAQVSPRHDFGAQVRVIGEPDSVQAYVTQAPVYEFNSVPLPVVVVGVEPNQTEVRLTDVEHWSNWGNYERAYMQWDWDETEVAVGPVSGWLKFNPTNQVAVSKYSDIFYPAGYTDIPLSITAAHETLNATCHLQWVAPDGTVQDTQTDGSVLYGHTIFVVRHTPGWVQGTTYADHDGRISPLTTRSVLQIPHWAKAEARLNQDIHWCNSDAHCSLWSSIFLPIVNGAESQTAQQVYLQSQVHAHKEGQLASTDACDITYSWGDDAGMNHGAGYWQAKEGDYYYNWTPYWSVPYGATEVAELVSDVDGSWEGSDGDYIKVEGWLDSCWMYL